MTDRLIELLEQDHLEDSQYDEARELLSQRYAFYITNPAGIEGYEYALWYTHPDGDEFPFLQSATLGWPVFASRDTDVGDGYEPTEDFFNLIAYAVHEAMSFTPVSYWEHQLDKFERLADEMYDGKRRHYEYWAAFHISRRMTLAPDCCPEARPLALWANQHTDFGVPILSGYNDD